MSSYLLEVVVPLIFNIVFITIFISIIASFFSVAKKRNSITKNNGFTFPKVNSSQHEGIHNDRFSHQNMHDYSEAYSTNNTVKDSGIKDKPLSEAEKNVLYGK